MQQDVTAKCGLDVKRLIPSHRLTSGAPRNSNIDDQRLAGTPLAGKWDGIVHRLRVAAELPPFRCFNRNLFFLCVRVM